MDTFQPGIIHSHIGLTNEVVIAKFRYSESLPEYPRNKPYLIKFAMNLVNHFILVDIYSSRNCMQASSLPCNAAVSNSRLIPRSESKLTVCLGIIAVKSCIHIVSKGLCHTYAALMA